MSAGVAAQSAGKARGRASSRTILAAPPNQPPMVSSITMSGAATADAPFPLKSPPVQQSNDLEDKLHRLVFAVVQKLKNKQALSTEESALVRDGKAEVQVWLTEKTDETMAQLKQLGFEVVSDAKNSRIVVGRLPVEQLEALAKFKFVKYVAPQR